MGENNWFETEIMWKDLENTQLYFIKEEFMEDTNISFSSGEIDQTNNFKVQSNIIKGLIQKHGLEQIRSLRETAKQEIEKEDRRYIINELVHYFRIRDKLKKTTSDLEIL